MAVDGQSAGGPGQTGAEQATGEEFERQRVPDRALLGFKSFVGMYAGEHCAGTELMIGPLFVAAGVSAFDLVVGLLLGNFLAVLSWTFLTAPIATRARFTLYYQLEKICGRSLVTLYNLANGVMFCFLAGAMITVSATAVGVWIDFPMPGLNDMYPNSLGWVLAVLGVGAAISIVAAYGYETVAKIANIAAPWMVVVFLAFGLVALAQFITSTGTSVRSPADLWNLARSTIWEGGPAFPGQAKFTFWHVTFFAWFCNMAMHIGMSDLSVLRFARKSWYGVASSTGMYLGHFMAWIAAALLYAYHLHQIRPAADIVAKLTALGRADLADAWARSGLNADLIRVLMELGVLKDPPPVLPGPLVYQAAGLTGLICVVIAGWTTANPTIYRAGLAFQAIMPRASRFTVTLATGLVATVAGMFPAIAMKLLNFVALYGLLLMPMGAVIFIDFWLMGKFGLNSGYAELSRKSFNWAAGLTWLLTLTICFALVKYAGVQIFFVSLPGWFIAAVLYIVLSKLYQQRLRQPQAVEAV